ncbi:ornithine carbamoyltransferase [Jimgerdemannia flammicorona]|uniref:ornithine carbamoyltransferase n=1 Tax=Jimgerdemannia flammicorona TaxID=994334 RepID=A0A433Q0W3_9FUNG|nr:ornithine carbamoyltransferase [Jimgerdemannia flammicorona]
MFSLPRPLLTRTFIGATTRRHYASAARPSPVHLLTLADLTAGQIHELLVSSAQHKRDAKHTDKPPPQPLRGKTMAIMFSKRSTRTRVATESALAYLGAHGMFLGSQDIQLGVNESLLDTSIVVSSMVDGIMARVYGHEDVETLARHSTVPIINALSAKYHPTQLLADLLTLHESATNSLTPTSDYSAHKTHPSKTLPGLRVAWVGDGNNILNEMLVSMPKLGVHLAAACPNGYTPDPDVVQIAKEDGKRTGAEVLLTTVPEEAVKSADVIVTDTWVSMGQETEKQRRLKDFAGYQITMDLARRGGANSGWKFMHCLPRKPEEVDDEVFYSDRSLVFPEAENRKWTILAAIDALLVRGRF